MRKQIITAETSRDFDARHVMRSAAAARRRPELLTAAVAMGTVVMETEDGLSQSVRGDGCRR